MRRGIIFGAISAIVIIGAGAAYAVPGWLKERAMFAKLEPLHAKMQTNRLKMHYIDQNAVMERVEMTINDNFGSFQANTFWRDDRTQQLHQDICKGEFNRPLVEVIFKCVPA